MTVALRLLVLEFEFDDRADPDDARQKQFVQGFCQAVSGRTYTPRTLEKLTWNNLGWRLGRIYGEVGNALIDELWNRSVRQYIARRPTPPKDGAWVESLAEAGSWPRPARPTT